MLQDNQQPVNPEETNPLPQAPQMEGEFSNQDAGFQSLEPPPPEASVKTVEPYSTDEIIGFAAPLICIGMQARGIIPATQEAANAFALGAGLIKPNKGEMRLYLPDALEPLQLGEALAQFGIGKNTGIGGISSAPAWLRLVVGAGVLAFGVFQGTLAARATTVVEA
jgi:hypothetical protein